MSGSCQVPRLSYIAKLPEETLSEIFMLAAHGSLTQRETYEIAPQSVTMPDILALVNRHWRRVALSDTSLWSTLVIDLDKMICNKTGDDWIWLNTMITRALSLLNERRTQGSGALHLESIKLTRTNDTLSLFWHFRPRFIQTVEGIPFAALMGDNSQDVPLKKTHLPKLRNISLYGVHLDWTAFHLSTLLSATPNQLLTPARHCIQSLELSHHSGEVRPTFDEFLGILKACPHLQRLVLRTSGPLPGRPPCQVSLPQLQYLHYEFPLVGDPADLFSGFHAPNLIKLSIGKSFTCKKLDGDDEDDEDDDDDDDEDGPANSLLRYCATHHPFPKLQELSLNGVVAPADAFRLFMASIPTILHLSLLGTPKAIRALTPIQDPLTGSRGVPCPVLESIQIFPKTRRFDLVDVLRERCKYAPRFAEWKCWELPSQAVVYRSDIPSGFRFTAKLSSTYLLTQPFVTFFLHSVSVVHLASKQAAGAAYKLTGSTRPTVFRRTIMAALSHSLVDAKTLSKAVVSTVVIALQLAVASLNEDVANHLQVSR
ncbi:hypothetical protein BDR07DRAFT_1378853 [Suillus spraguei]|nr:hypothetical protein BDR07DRAFT_1378853 [Suillus spraguei]